MYIKEHEKNIRTLKEILYQIGDKELEAKGLECIAGLETDSQYKDETIWRLTKEDFDSCLSEKGIELTDKQKAELFENAKSSFGISDCSEWIALFIDEQLNNKAETLEIDTSITCSVCGKTFDEGQVNIVDYDDDVCVNCEKTYLTPKKQVGYMVGISKYE